MVMAPLLLDGTTLGQKHRSYNNIVSQIKQNEISEINYQETDLDNLLRIDIACKNKNVDYILKVFQSEDMLYVSRAIKQSTWLITDPRYSHIINPEYLHNTLSPNMTVKSFNKLLLHVRVNLKDEVRAEEFFHYYKERDCKLALKWLPLCSVKIIEGVIEIRANDIPNHMVKRLCEKSVTCLERYFHSCNQYATNMLVGKTRIHLKNNTEKYLTLLEMSQPMDIPKFGAKQTKLIMTKCDQRVLTNMHIYGHFLHTPTLVKFIKREHMKDFILTNIQSTRFLFTHDEITPFINRLPKKSRFKLIRELFIDRTNNIISDGTIRYCCGIKDQWFKHLSNAPTFQHIYCWYKYAPFNIALVDLKKLIRLESCSSERMAMCAVLLTSAGEDMKNVQSLLKYYRDNHINEPFKFKIQFINIVLTHTDTHKFDKITWGYLNDLFKSMEVYNESENMVQFCVRAIILYNIVHGISIPDIIQQKFLYDSYKKYQNKLKKKDKRKLFLFLYQHLMSKIETLDTNKKKDCSKAIIIINNVLNLFIDWNKELKDFPIILEKIKEVIRSKERNKCKLSLTELFNVKKSWKKLFFDESILLSCTQETCINALKHGSDVLEKYKDSVEAMCLSDVTPKDNFLKKIRIYWSQTLANTYKDLFMNKLDQRKLHKVVIMGLYTLLPASAITKLLAKYAPFETKINRDQQNNLELSIRKYLAMKLFLARPLPSLSLVLLYAKGDHVRYVMPSLRAILNNISNAKFREHLPRLLRGPVSLQKLSLKVAFFKLSRSEFEVLLSDVWKSTENKNMRAEIFNKTFFLFCGEKKAEAIRHMRQLLRSFIDNLTFKENQVIYTNLSKVEKVPPLVRPEYWIKSYKFLKLLPPDSNCNALLAHLKENMSDIMHALDNDVAAEILMESFEEQFSTRKYEYADLRRLSLFLLTSKTEEMHIKRYKKILIPILDKSLAWWEESQYGTNYVQMNLQKIFQRLDEDFKGVVLNHKMVMPIPLYTEIFTILREKLPLLENHFIITTRKLALDCIKVFDKILNSKNELKTLRDCPKSDNYLQWEQLYNEAAPEIGRICCQYLKEDANIYFPSMYIPFADVFDHVCENFGFSNFSKVKALKSVIEFEEADHFHLFVLKLLPFFGYHEELELKSEILEDISTHTSKVVRMNYWFLKDQFSRANVI